MFRKFLLTVALKRRGYSDAQIDKAFKIIEAETGRPILDWLSDGGFEEILAWIAAIIALFSGMDEKAVDPNQPGALGFGVGATEAPPPPGEPHVTVMSTPYGLVITLPKCFLQPPPR